jgi:hypothetical protein
MKIIYYVDFDDKDDKIEEATVKIREEMEIVFSFECWVKCSLIYIRRI